MTDVLERLRGGLVVSCQPVDNGPMDHPKIVAAMAQAAVNGGAAGLRIEGIENLRAVRPLVDVPIIGIVKTDSDDTPVRITVSKSDVSALTESGADIVAYDATDRPRKDPKEAILASILANGAIAMADCSTLVDARVAHAAGVAILGTTLSGYTAATETDGEGPDLELVRQFRTLNAFVMAEGRVNTPSLAPDAMAAGADCVTVGSALTRLELMTAAFVKKIQGRLQ
ncbi:MAG: putative N-acetylmannosamine-6-phosphate 2-epimerase [Marinovum sp.]|jgi:N-acylglucosamine-6-phosphate 2-epimerase|nr:putative N-acetylmannosamine-6-phosphate 2-epimerase [Marinovum sp.]MBT6531625.1 putative N-acetylmannosamine-6-phosphate 2-epimerase [Marinovum sp.]MBT7906414.1 putative N-acetylmannosamine-6-phosphate 2-epimerase [Marinovum sp.]